ncbi:MAG: hypothetical protein ABIG03_01945 [Candidatus Eisenbacteria bacterium]
MRYVVMAIVIAALAIPAGAQMYLESGGPPIRYDDSIPPDGSQWHELYPAFCTPRIQNSYEDNGDGVVSACDVIVIDGIRNHVDWAGPTYYIAHAQVGERWLEPEPGIPDMYHEVAPVFCTTWEVLDWDDVDQDTEISFCDMLLLSDGWWHVEDVRLDITVTEEPSPVEQSTWGKIKSWFGSIL